MGENEGSGPSFGERPTTEMPKVEVPPPPPPPAGGVPGAGGPAAPKGGGAVWWIAGVVALIAIVAGVWLLLSSDERVTVPDVTGMVLARATREVEDAGLRIGTFEVAVTDPSVAASGTVIAQQPTPGTRVDPGTAVVLVVAVGQPAPVAEEATVTTGVDAGPDAEPGPEPEPEPEPEATPTPTPGPTLTTILSAEGRGDWASAGFMVETSELQVRVFVSSPSSEQFGFRLSAPGAAAIAWVAPSTPAPRDFIWDRRVSPGVWRFSIDAPPDGEWSFKIREVR